MHDRGGSLFGEEQIQRLLDLHRHLDTRLAPRDLLRRIVAEVAGIAGTKVALVERRDGIWTTLAESSAAPPLPAASDLAAWKALGCMAATLGRSVLAWRWAGAVWTLVGLGSRADAPILLMLEGDWTPSGPVLLQVAANLVVAERAAALAFQSYLARLTHRLTRVLGRTSGERSVCEAALRVLVRVVPSRMASFAVPRDDGRLAVVATQGYPQALVDHVRIAPGTPVIGTVYETRTALRVSDAAEYFGAGHRRPRYRTRSFLVLPVVAGRDVVGVVSLTDRADDGPFTKDDVAVLRAVLAPVALALARERQRLQAETYARAAASDALSGLHNRRYFQGRLDEELQRARRSGTPAALLMIDVDDFKPINDRYGHLAGDQVIAGLADILRRAVRAFDVCARYGGEEFAVLMPGNPLEHAVTTAERIRQRIEAYRPADLALAGLRVTVSIGLAMTAPTTTARDLIDRADRALYAAKRAGKNRVEVDAGD